MARYVRWVLQASKPGHDDWVNQEDRVYSGWFHSTGNDEPAPTVVEQYEKAVEELDWLDVRLIQETKNWSTVVLKQTSRGETGD